MFKDVTVVPMTGGAEAAHVNVVVRGDRIERVDAAPPPEGATIIDGHGKYLAPGMVDMHLHLPADAPDAALERIALLSLLNGVTTVRSMQGAPKLLAFRATVTDGAEVSPELYLAGPPLAETFTPEAARARVREQKAAGYDFIKILGGFDLPAYDAVIDEARRVGMPVVGHVPSEIGIDAALASHQVTVEHMMGYADAAKTSDAALDALAKKTHDAHVWNCPTIDWHSMTGARRSSQARSARRARVRVRERQGRMAKARAVEEHRGGDRADAPRGARLTTRGGRPARRLRRAGAVDRAGLRVRRGDA